MHNVVLCTMLLYAQGCFMYNVVSRETYADLVFLKHKNRQMMTVFNHINNLS